MNFLKTLFVCKEGTFNSPEELAVQSDALPRLGPPAGCCYSAAGKVSVPT